MQIANQTNFQPLPIPWIEKLIQKMHILFGAKFAQQWEGISPEIMKQEWAEELAGFSGPELAKGLDACRAMARGFVPTLPEFMALCRPPINHEIAFHEAVHGLVARRKGERGEWPHPAIYHATISVGQHEMLNCTYAVMRTRWEKALDKQMAKSEWGPVPEPALALPEPKRTELTDAQAKQAMNKMGAGNVLDKSGRDHKAWARKIIDNPKSRSPTVIAMARSAIEAVAA